MVMTDNEYTSPEEFSGRLDAETGERGMQKLLEGRPQILYWALCRAGGHYRCVFREFPLGSRYKADFVVLNSYSGVWEVIFVELEPVDDRILTKAGLPTKRLAGAIKQVQDWRDYFESHKEAVRADLVRWARTKDILGYSDPRVISNHSCNYLESSGTYLKDQYKVIIGRRKVLDASGHQRKARYSDRVEVMTYDRLKDLVDLRYRDEEPFRRP